LSGAVVAEIAPVLLLTPIAGAVVDRLPRVAVMMIADLVRMVLAAVLAVWHRDIAMVYGVAFGLSAGTVFFNPAAGSLLPNLWRRSSWSPRTAGSGPPRCWLKSCWPPSPG